MSVVRLKNLSSRLGFLLICEFAASCLAEYVVVGEAGVTNSESIASLDGSGSETSNSNSGKDTGETNGDESLTDGDADTQSEEAIPCGGHKYICDGECVSIRKNPLHCGACNAACAEGLQCRKGECEKGCGDKCVWNLEQCVQGACQCRDGLVRCGTECVDIRRNPRHCGSCDQSCSEGACGDSVCQTMACPGFPDHCSGACTDVQTDALNCGVCGNLCNFDEVCISGECHPYDRFDECITCPCEPCQGACCTSSFVDVSICVDREGC